jgi:hypothetical protein
MKVLLLVSNSKKKYMLYISKSLCVVKEKVKFMATERWINNLVKEFCELMFDKTRAEYTALIFFDIM